MQACSCTANHVGCAACAGMVKLACQRVEGKPRPMRSRGVADVSTEREIAPPKTVQELLHSSYRTARATVVRAKGYVKNTSIEMKVIPPLRRCPRYGANTSILPSNASVRVSNTQSITADVSTIHVQCCSFILQISPRVDFYVCRSQREAVSKASIGIVDRRQRSLVSD